MYLDRTGMKPNTALKLTVKPLACASVARRSLAGTLDVSGGDEL